MKAMIRSSLTPLPFLLALALAPGVTAMPQIEIGGADGGINDARARIYEELQRESRETPVSRIAQAVTPAVVFVETELVQNVRTFFGIERRTNNGSGSGVVIHELGYIVTNYHVVEGAQQIRVSFEGEPTSYPAKLLSFVREEDLALLKIDPVRVRGMGSLGRPGAETTAEPKLFEKVLMGTSADLMIGEPLVAIGSPHGQTHTVSTGILSGNHRDVDVPSRNLRFRDLIQTDASINLGNSGGPLLNIHGELIGINTVMNSVAENIGFAIPVDRVRQVLEEELLPNARQAWLGFDVEDQGGALTITKVWEEGPAAASGLCEGDRIVSVGGEPVRTMQDYDLQVLQVLPGQETMVGLLRGGNIEEATVRSWDEANGYFYREVGMTVSEERLKPRRTYLMVQQVRPGSPASELGVQTGDLIPAIRPRVARAQAYWLRDKASLKALLERLDPGTEIEVDAYRDLNKDLSYEPNEQLKGVLIR